MFLDVEKELELRCREGLSPIGEDPTAVMSTGASFKMASFKPDAPAVASGTLGVVISGVVPGVGSMIRSIGSGRRIGGSSAPSPALAYLGELSIFFAVSSSRFQSK